jgi:three-Cys-motif partner protein
MARSWGFWTQYKLELLQRYLDAFTTATKRSEKIVYLDLFAGGPDNVDRDTESPIDGSPRIALDITDRPFSHLRFFEMGSNIAKLREALSEEYANRDWSVHEDCNASIGTVLSDLKRADAGWAPTFAFIDPNGPHYTWKTLEALAAHKGPRAKTKVELWMLFPQPLFVRLLPRTGDVRPVDNVNITAMYGDPAWHAIWKAKLDQRIDPAQARTEYVNLMRWRLERELGYQWTHQLEIRNSIGPLYQMIFATDSEPGNKIMTHLYERAASEFPQMAEAARLRRDQKRREEVGEFDLFSSFGGIEGLGGLSPGSDGNTRGLYRYEKPDEPLEHDATTCPFCDWYG